MGFIWGVIDNWAISCNSTMKTFQNMQFFASDHHFKSSGREWTLSEISENALYPRRSSTPRSSTAKLQVVMEASNRAEIFREDVSDPKMLHSATCIATGELQISEICTECSMGFIGRRGEFLEYLVQFATSCNQIWRQCALGLYPLACNTVLHLEF